MKECPYCGILNEDEEYKCGYCKADLMEAQTIETSRAGNAGKNTGKVKKQQIESISKVKVTEVKNICIICNKVCRNGQILSNGSVYHENCYVELGEKRNGLLEKIQEYRRSASRLMAEIDSAESFLGKMKYFLLRKDKFEIEIKRNRLEKYKEQFSILTNKLNEIDNIFTSIYDYWLTYPPDWDERAKKVRDRFPFCHKCGSNYPRLQVHHDIPISKGGNHTIENLILLCEDCHRIKHGGKEFRYQNREKLGAFPKRLLLLKEAISNSKIVHFSYKNSEGRHSVRSMGPEKFKEVGMTLCVFGWCYLRNEIRAFAVKRMRGVKIVNSPGKCYYKK
jgi:hypothetical protein